MGGARVGTRRVTAAVRPRRGLRSLYVTPRQRPGARAPRVALRTVPPCAAGAPTTRPPGGRTAGALLRASHPVPAVAVTGVATALTAAIGQPPPRCVAVAAAVLAGQLSVGWCNDAVDAVRDRAAGRADKPVATGAVTVRTAWTAALAALALCVPLSLTLGVPAGALHLLAVAAAWAYNLGLKSTVWSWLPYAAAFGALPGFVTLQLPGAPWPAGWTAAAAALLGVGAHLANVLPDIAHDLRQGVTGWPQRLGRRRVRLLLPLPCVAATGLTAHGTGGGTAGAVAVAATALLAGGAAALAPRRPRLPFLATVGVAVLDATLLGTSA